MGCKVFLNGSGGRECVTEDDGTTVIDPQFTPPAGRTKVGETVAAQIFWDINGTTYLKIGNLWYTVTGETVITTDANGAFEVNQSTTEAQTPQGQPLGQNPAMTFFRTNPCWVHMGNSWYKIPC